MEAEQFVRRKERERTAKSRSKTVIVAESNFLTARLIMASLQARGLPATFARDGDGVFRLLDKHDVVLLVLNMNLGRPSGSQLLRTLQMRYPKLKVLAITSAGQAELKSAADALGASTLIELPFSPTDLCDRVQRMIGV